nr:uncharacterized protein LOC101241084 isoform X2 [Hydra vulgaris]
MESVTDCTVFRHKLCPILIPLTISKCEFCLELRKYLNLKQFRLKEKQNKIALDSGNNSMFSNKKNDRYMSKEELLFKIKILENDKKKIATKSLHLQCRINQLIKKEGLIVDGETHKVMKECLIDKNYNPFSESSPQYLLWEQQKIQVSRKDKRSMKWHPVLIRWCLSIYLKSPETYKHLTKSEFMYLPCKNTLLKYINFTDPGCGFNADVISRLILNADIKNLKEHEKNVSLVFDEMKIKSGLVFSKTTGKIVGLTEMGSLNDALDEFKNKIEGNKSINSPTLAKYVIVFMVRGIFSSLCYPFGHFASCGFNSDQIFNCAWEATRILECIGFKVRSMVADGASPNRKFFRIHLAENYENVKDTTVHWTWNIWCSTRKLYFFCDVPHLIKTTRNNLENSHWNQNSRNLMIEDQFITWPQIMNVYEWDLGMFHDAVGLRMGHKLRDEHIQLTPQSRMRVNLAAQVLSQTVVHMLEEQGKAETRCLQKFINLIDTFFDCLNVSRQFNKTRKPALDVYKTHLDKRFECTHLLNLVQLFYKKKV